MGRRPNAHGGRNNQNKPAVAARARFSNWKPPVKTLKEKFERQVEVHRRKEVVEFHTASPLATEQFTDTISPGVRCSDQPEIFVSSDIIHKINTTWTSLNMVRAPGLGECNQVSEISLESRTKGNISVKSQISHCDTSNRIELYAMKPLKNIGFSVDEISLVCEKLKDYVELDQDILYTTLIILIFRQSIPILKQKNINQISQNELNEVLNEELMCLNTIFDNQISQYIVDTFIDLIHIIDISIPSLNGNKSQDESFQIRIILYKSDCYPDGDFSCYGWLRNNAFNSSINRNVSITCTNYINSIRKGSPILFDVIQYFQSNLPTDSSLNQVDGNKEVTSSPANITHHTSRSDGRAKVVQENLGSIKEVKYGSYSPAVSTNNMVEDKSKVAISSGTNSNSDSSSKNNNSSVGVLQTHFTESIEYRTAFSRALNEGYAGQAARDQVSGWLQG